MYTASIILMSSFDVHLIDTCTTHACIVVDHLSCTIDM